MKKKFKIAWIAIVLVSFSSVMFITNKKTSRTDKQTYKIPQNIENQLVAIPLVVLIPAILDTVGIISTIAGLVGPFTLPLPVQEDENMIAQFNAILSNLKNINTKLNEIYISNYRVLSSIESGFADLKTLNRNLSENQFNVYYETFMGIVQATNKPISDFSDEDYQGVYQHILDSRDITMGPIDFRNKILVDAQNVASISSSILLSLSTNLTYSNNFKSKDYKLIPAVFYSDRYLNSKITDKEILTIYQTALIYLLKAEIVQYIILKGAPSHFVPYDSSSIFDNLRHACYKAIGSNIPGYITLSELNKKTNYLLAPFFTEKDKFYPDNITRDIAIEGNLTPNQLPRNFNQYVWSTLDPNVMDLVDKINLDSDIHRDLFKEHVYGVSDKVSIYDLLNQAGLKSDAVEARSKFNMDNYRITGLFASGRFGYKFALLTIPGRTLDDGYYIMNHYVPAYDPNSTFIAPRLQELKNKENKVVGYISFQGIDSMSRTPINRYIDTIGPKEYCYLSENFIGSREQCESRWIWDRSWKQISGNDPNYILFRDIYFQKNRFKDHDNQLYGPVKKGFITEHEINKLFNLNAMPPVLHNPYMTTLISMEVQTFQSNQSLYDITTIENGITPVKYCENKYQDSEFTRAVYDSLTDSVVCHYIGGHSNVIKGLPFSKELPFKDFATKWNIPKKDFQDSFCNSSDASNCPIISSLKQINFKLLESYMQNL